MNNNTNLGQTMDHWGAVRGRVRKHWPEISDEDLEDVQGDSRRLVSIIHQKAGGTLSEIEAKIDEIAEHSQGLLSRIGESASDYATSVKDAAVNGTTYVSEQVERCVNSTSDAAQHAYSAVKDYAACGYDATCELIRTNPYRASSIAFSVGAILGFSLLKSMMQPPPTYRERMYDWWNK